MCFSVQYFGLLWRDSIEIKSWRRNESSWFQHTKIECKIKSLQTRTLIVSLDIVFPQELDLDLVRTHFWLIIRAIHQAAGSQNGLWRALWLPVSNSQPMAILSFYWFGTSWNWEVVMNSIVKVWLCIRLIRTHPIVSQFSSEQFWVKPKMFNWKLLKTEFVNFN